MTVIGTGVDITEVTRLKKAILKWQDAFLSKVYTPAELRNARAHGFMYQHLAGRFAAKEAIFKALGNKDLTWQDLEIVNDREGRPHCSILNGKGANARVHLSISHVKEYAVASAVITKKG